MRVSHSVGRRTSRSSRFEHRTSLTSFSYRQRVATVVWWINPSSYTNSRMEEAEEGKEENERRERESDYLYYLLALKSTKTRVLNDDRERERERERNPV